MYPPVPEILLATILSGEGHDVAVADANAAPGSWPATAARAARYDLVVSQSSWFTLRDDAAALAALKERNPALRTALFGAAPTFSPDAVCARTEIDHAVEGDPERPLVALARAVASGATAPRRLAGPRTDDLDSLPLPDRRRFLPHDPGIYRNPLPRRLPFTTIFSSRGCGGRCVFCSAHEFSAGGRVVMSPARTVEEVRHAVRQGYAETFFRDEHLDSPPGRIEEICRLLGTSGLSPLPGWTCNIRADGVDGETLAAMKAAGCHTIKVGVETGDDALRARAGKPIPGETYLRVFRKAAALGIRAHAHFVLGLPGETSATIDETVRFARRLKPASATFGILTPFPGVPLAAETGSGEPAPRGGGADGFHARASTSPPADALPAAELDGAVRRAYRRFYLHPASWPGLVSGSLPLSALLRRTRAGAGALAFSLSSPDAR